SFFCRRSLRHRPLFSNPRRRAMIRFACPSCTTTVSARDREGGEVIFCPKCGQRVQIPPPPSPKSQVLLGKPLPSKPDAPVRPQPRPQEPVPYDEMPYSPPVPDYSIYDQPQRSKYGLGMAIAANDRGSVGRCSAF